MTSAPRFALIVAASAVLIGATPGLARAMEPFPGEIQTHLGLSYAPPCNICHQTPAGGGPIVHPFGFAMVANGLGATGAGSIPAALDALSAQQIDSDCNHLDDVDQLEAGRDPNLPGEFIDGSGQATLPDPGCTTSNNPVYGCDPGTQLAAGRSPGLGTAALPALVGLAFARRRRAGKRASARRAPKAG